MTPGQFRKLALELPEAVEDAHMGHPDFRVRRKIFATLGAPSKEFAMVKLTPGQQAEWVKKEPDVFVSVAGGWGRGGATNVRLKSAKRAAVRAALLLAWRNVAPAVLIEESEQM